jgi:hypothetical protein
VSEEAGELVPMALLPRYTSYVGPGTYTTVPLRVSEFSGALVTFWRGPLAGGDTFEAYIEEATVPDDTATAWTEVDTTPAQPFTTTNTHNALRMTFTKEWMRVRIVLTNHPTLFFVGLTVYMTGVLQRRIPPGNPGHG